MDRDCLFNQVSGEKNGGEWRKISFFFAFILFTAMEYHSRYYFEFFLQISKALRWLYHLLKSLLSFFCRYSPKLLSP